MQRNVLVNARTKRVIALQQTQAGREPAKDRHTPKHLIGGEAWALSMSSLYEDVPNDLWRIHGHLYDLSAYMDLHPGGNIFLEKTRGTDCTEAFECHHVRGVSETIMSKYRVSTTPPTTSTARFTFEESYQEIKHFVKEYLRTQVKNSPTGATPWWAGMLYTGIVVQFLLAFRFAVKRNSIPLAMMAGLMLTGVWGVGHNQIHRGRGKQNKWRALRFALDLTGFSSQHQTITHALSHHQNPNTNYDVEIYEFNEPGLQWLTSDAKNSSALYLRVPALFIVLASQTVPFTILQRFAGRTRDGDLLHTDIMFPLCMLAYAAKHHGMNRALLLCWTMWSSFAAWFVPSSLSLHHGHDEHTGEPVCYHEGEPDGFERDFARHQIRSTRDHSPGMNHYLALMLFAHLNCHTVHHLFPTIDRVYHEDILQKLLEANVGSFRDVYYSKPNSQSFLQLYTGIFRHIRDRRFEPL